MQNFVKNSQCKGGPDTNFKMLLWLCRGWALPYDFFVHHMIKLSFQRKSRGNWVVTTSCTSSGIIKKNRRLFISGRVQKRVRHFVTLSAIGRLRNENNKISQLLFFFSNILAMIWDYHQYLNGKSGASFNSFWVPLRFFFVFDATTTRLGNKISQTPDWPRW